MYAATLLCMSPKIEFMSLWKVVGTRLKGMALNSYFQIQLQMMSCLSTIPPSGPDSILLLGPESSCRQAVQKVFCSRHREGVWLSHGIEFPVTYAHSQRAVLLWDHHHWRCPWPVAGSGYASLEHLSDLFLHHRLSGMRNSIGWGANWSGLSSLDLHGHPVSPSWFGSKWSLACSGLSSGLMSVTAPGDSCSYHAGIQLSSCSACSSSSKHSKLTVDGDFHRASILTWNVLFLFCECGM